MSTDLRQQLDALGYTQPLPLGAVALVGAVFEDLVKTTESLRDSKLRIADLLEEKACWELGVEPYKCDNSKLLAECNQLHLELMQVKEDCEQRICDYNLKLRNLESDKRYLEEHCKELEHRIKLSKETEMKSAKVKKDFPENKPPFISTVRMSDCSHRAFPSLDSADNKCAKCNKGSKGGSKDSGAIPLARHSLEMERMQNTVKDLSDSVDFYKKKIACRDREIARLNDLLCGGRPPAALAKDCCYKEASEQSDEADALQKDRVKYYQERMHEAMQKSCELDEKNKKLQRTLDDLKNTALAVESRANSEICDREEEVQELRRKVELLEGRSSKGEETRRLNEKVNALTQRESEVSLEMDKFQKKYQKIKERMNALQKENDELTRQARGSCQLDEDKIRLKTERDFFQKEYLRLIAKAGSDKELELLRCQLQLKEEEIKQLKSELCRNSQFHYHHQPTATHSAQPSSSECVQAVVLRAERERDVVKAELDRVRFERDSLREKLQSSSQSHENEMRSYREKIDSLNSKILLLEKENRESTSARIPGQTQIILLKEELEDLRRQICDLQSENSQLKMNLSNLRILQDQTERALVQYQNKCAIAETQLGNAESKLSMFSSRRESACNDINLLQNEIAALKATYVNIENEKDRIVSDLDLKTERVYQLETELKDVKQHNNELQKKVCELRDRLERQSRQSRDSENKLHENSSEVKTLRQQVAALTESRNKAIDENSCLASQLADCQSDAIGWRRKLKESEKEVLGLRKQMKQYMKEVEKAEDLLHAKDRERQEMLEHYKTLSHDAVILEGNNQSLETESIENKQLLSEAEDSITRLKQELGLKAQLIEKLEKQVTTLTTQNSRLEQELEQAYDDQRLLKIDLDARKELCDKLDLQKERLDAELTELEEIRRKLEKDNEKLRKDTEVYNSGSQASIESLEGLLKETRCDLEKQVQAQSRLTQELVKLKENNANLEKRLATESERRKQQEALAKEFDVQNQELRHNITDDRFRQARSREESQSPRYYSETM